MSNYWEWTKNERFQRDPRLECAQRSTKQQRDDPTPSSTSPYRDLRGPPERQNRRRDVSRNRPGNPFPDRRDGDFDRTGNACGQRQRENTSSRNNERDDIIHIPLWINRFTMLGKGNVVQDLRFLDGTEVRAANVGLFLEEKILLHLGGCGVPVLHAIGLTGVVICQTSTCKFLKITFSALAIGQKVHVAILVALVLSTKAFISRR